MTQACSIILLAVMTSSALVAVLGTGALIAAAVQ